MVNIVFAHRQSDYLTAAGRAVTPAELLVAGAGGAVLPDLARADRARRRPPPARAKVIGWLVAMIWPISLVACIYLTSHSQPWAFFSLPTRAWELLDRRGAGPHRCPRGPPAECGPRRGRLGRAGRRGHRRRHVQRHDGVPGLRGDAARAGHCRHRGRRHDAAERPGLDPALEPAPVGRSPLVRDLPLALAGHRARRRQVGPPDPVAARPGGARIGRRVGHLVLGPRRPRPALAVARGDGPGAGSRSAPA